MQCLSKLPEGQTKKRFIHLIKKYPYTSRVEVFPANHLLIQQVMQGLPGTWMPLSQQYSCYAHTNPLQVSLFLG